jgi:hypothetical protein
MNLKIEKIFKVNNYDFHRNVYETEIKLTIKSLEESEIYLSNSPGIMDLAAKQKETVMFVVESKEFPIPEYVIDVVIDSSAKQLAWQFEKEVDCVAAPFTSVCTIDDFSLDVEAATHVIEMVVEMIEAYWNSVKGGIYEY